jgi:beclin 1
MRAGDVRQGVNPPFELPYPISGDKVDGKKMTFTFNRDENWTQALQLMLTDLKLMLAWLSHKD